MLALDPQRCYDALVTRDRRFDGRFFVAVTSTGIYCRPVCPAPAPKLSNCRFYRSAAAAHEAGFRPCLRCRPETAPHTGAWLGTSNTVSRGLALIADGALDGASVDELAERLGVGARHLRRLFREHLGASPIAVGQTRRVLLAKQLIHETRLPLTEVALASGFGSIRRFNETFQRLFNRPPSALRRSAAVELPAGSAETTGVTVRLRYLPPYDWTSLLSHLRVRAIDQVECINGGVYLRTFAIGAATGTMSIRHLPDVDSLEATIRVKKLGVLAQVIHRIRSAFDLEADLTAITARFADDPILGRSVERRPGLRVPGGWDPFEVGARAILGQQVSVESGRCLSSQLVALCGARIRGAVAGLERVFPTAERVVQADLGLLRTPRARARALKAWAAAALSDATLFEPRATVEDTVAHLRTVPGVGDWTAHYVAMRAIREPDAFPASDVGLLRAAAAPGRPRPTPTALTAVAERWRPWRAYAAQHLWTADATEETL